MNLHEAFHSQQAEARQMLVRDEDGNLHIGLPIKFADEYGIPAPDLQELGEHTEEIVETAKNAG
ncbi:MAG: hypothetical protein QNJ35_05305 [Paracoccaceae bacterium]|nr:hypothetical protein [Paracoccaceae bacterium]